MIYKVETNESIETIKNEFEQQAKEHSFTLLNSYEFQKILETKGFPIDRNANVFEICNPAGAQQALTKVPQMSAYLPCRVSLYEDEGKTILTTISFEDIISELDVDNEMKSHMDMLYTNLKNLMNSWN